MFVPVNDYMHIVLLFDVSVNASIFDLPNLCIMYIRVCVGGCVCAYGRVWLWGYVRVCLSYIVELTIQLSWSRHKYK